MKKTSLALLLAVTSVAVSAADEPKTESLLSKYNLDADIGSSPNRSFFLTKDGDKWAWSNTGSIKREGVDLIAVDFQTRTVRLVTDTSPNEAATKAQHLSFGGSKLGAGNDYKAGRDEDGRWNCVYSTMPKSMDNANREVFGYNICGSSFLKEMPKKGDPGSGNLWRSRKFVVIDKDKLFSAIESSGLSGELEKLELTAYRGSFERAKTSVALKTFAMNYQKIGFDPDNLIAKAETLAKEREIEEDKAADARAAAKQADAKRIAEERAAAEKRRAEQLAAEKLAVEKWRKTIAVETETSCGPVIGIIGKELVKVYFQVPGMQSNEHVMKRSELSPAGTTCEKFAGIVKFQKGDKVCNVSSGTTQRVLKLEYGTTVNGDPEAITIRTVANVEEQGPEKLKLTIAGITTNNLATGKKENTGDRISWDDGTSRQVGQVIWDTRKNWARCN